MIELNNYQFLQYNININIDQNQNTIIYSPNSNVLKKLALEMAGINKSEGIKYNGNDVYDNKAYFENRIYIDCNTKYLNTLLARNVQETMENSYNIIIDTNKFTSLVKKLQIRSCGELNNDYKFTKEGIALSDITLALSIYRYHLLFTPLENITNEQHLNNVKEEIKNMYNLMFSTNLANYKNISDSIIVLGFKKVFYLQDDSIIYIIKKIEERIINELNLTNNIIYKSNKSTLCILDNKISLEIIKKLNTLGKLEKEKIINIDSIINGDKYEAEN